MTVPFVLRNASEYIYTIRSDTTDGSASPTEEEVNFRTKFFKKKKK